MHHRNISFSGEIFKPSDSTGTVYDFSYTGSVQSMDLGPGVYKLEVWGAQGGTYNSSNATGGKGGYSVGVLTLLDNKTTIYAYSGGKGTYHTTSTYTSQGGGGFNGGGGAGYRGGGGGGASDFRIGTDSLYSRVIVAGGGGGAYAYSSTYKANGGDGGGTSGNSGAYYNSSYIAFIGGGASQTAGGTGGTGSSSNYNGNAGSFGIGGSTGYKYNSTSYYSNGAGGGGWYGGGGAGNYSSSSRARSCGGGGGSGYVYTSDSQSSYPSGCLLTSSHLLSEASTISGSSSFTSPSGSSETGHSGDGHCRITVLSGMGKYYPTVKRCSYIENDGTDYIQTDIYPSNTNAYTVSYKMQINESGVTKAYFGARTGTSSATVTLFQVSGKMREDWNTTQTTGDTVVSGTTYERTFGGLNTTAFTSSAPFAVFNLNTAGTLDGRMGIAKIYYIKFFDSSGNLTMHLVPCKYDGNKGCLYDKIGKKIYLSNGGKITAG